MQKPSSSSRKLASYVGPREVVAAVALALIGIGLGIANLPAGVAVPGFLLFGLAVWPLLILPRGGGKSGPAR